jgi:hypothetical protein
MKGRKPFLFGISTRTLVAALALFWVGTPRTVCAEAQHPADPPDTHNMVAIGEDTIYLSHLPMFQIEGGPPMFLVLAGFSLHMFL